MATTGYDPKLSYCGRIPTWQELAKLEPRINDLRDEVLALPNETEEDFAAAHRLYHGPGGIRRRRAELVGDSRNPEAPVLCSCEAFDVVRDRLYRLLPPRGGESALTRPLQAARRRQKQGLSVDWRRDRWT